MFVFLAPKVYGYTDVDLCQVEAERQLREVACANRIHLRVELLDVGIAQATQAERYRSADIREDVGCHTRIEVEAHLVAIRNRATPLVVEHKVESRAAIRALQLQLTKDTKATTLVDWHIGAMEEREGVGVAQVLECHTLGAELHTVDEVAEVDVCVIEITRHMGIAQTQANREIVAVEPSEVWLNAHNRASKTKILNQESEVRIVGRECAIGCRDTANPLILVGEGTLVDMTVDAIDCLANLGAIGLLSKENTLRICCI